MKSLSYRSEHAGNASRSSQTLKIRLAPLRLASGRRWAWKYHKNTYCKKRKQGVGRYSATGYLGYEQIYGRKQRPVHAEEKKAAFAPFERKEIEEIGEQIRLLHLPQPVSAGQNHPAENLLPHSAYANHPILHGNHHDRIEHDTLSHAAWQERGENDRPHSHLTYCDPLSHIAHMGLGNGHDPLWMIHLYALHLHNLHAQEHSKEHENERGEHGHHNERQHGNHDHRNSSHEYDPLSHITLMGLGHGHNPFWWIHMYALHGGNSNRHGESHEHGEGAQRHENEHETAGHATGFGFLAHEHGEVEHAHLEQGQEGGVSYVHDLDQHQARQVAELLHLGIVLHLALGDRKEHVDEKHADSGEHLANPLVEPPIGLIFNLREVKQTRLVVASAEPPVEPS